MPPHWAHGSAHSSVAASSCLDAKFSSNAKLSGHVQRVPVAHGHDSSEHSHVMVLVAPAGLRWVSSKVMLEPLPVGQPVHVAPECCVMSAHSLPSKHALTESS